MVLSVLEQEELHIILDFRHYESAYGALAFNAVSRPKWTWSIATSIGFLGACETARRASQRLKAVEWSHPIGQGIQNRHVKLLDELHSSPMLEELHVSERALDLESSLSQYSSNAPQICRLVTTLPLLRRVRIEGADLTAEFLKILPNLTMLHDLSIYSVYRRVFHQGCDELDGEMQPTDPMPWLQLPNLKKLDLKFVCKHFTMPQLIPKGLIALRIEFYGSLADEHLTPEDLDWLALNCPDLERLELDIGSLESPESYAEMLVKLGQFRKLRTLRLFPTYWRKGKLLPHPFKAEQSLGSSVDIFARLRRLCSNLQTLIISISFGEYPFDIVSRMWLVNRPSKFVLRNVGAKDDILVRWGYAAHDEMYETLFRGEEVVSDSRAVISSEHGFFDDLNENWILEHHELHRRTV